MAFMLFTWKQDEIVVIINHWLQLSERYDIPLIQKHVGQKVIVERWWRGWKYPNLRPHLHCQITYHFEENVSSIYYMDLSHLEYTASI